MQDSRIRTAHGRDGSQYERKIQRLNFDQTRMPIPPKKKMAEAMVSRLIGKRYAVASLLRFHSSLALRFSAGDNGVPNTRAEAVKAMKPATTSATPTSWIKKISTIYGFYQCLPPLLDLNSLPGGVS